jgi:Fe-S cluster assembly scaffold protein SufB
MTRKNYFEKEEDFLRSIQNKEGVVLSKIKIEGTLILTPELLLEKNFVLEYCDVSVYENAFSYVDAIFRNKSDIFIYLSKKDVIEKSYQTMVYFNSQNIEEVKFFIKSLIKLK